MLLIIMLLSYVQNVLRNTGIDQSKQESTLRHTHIFIPILILLSKSKKISWLVFIPLKAKTQITSLQDFVESKSATTKMEEYK